ncbi:hypothetical protein F442_08441 [Phytophthora nicotianae P10297]|uniref:Uncharacterized protein n=3 Tax=Phytophthora nicotianae TaxID=4792 RepID=V9F6X1_PHYNI|nr:hypothetical protein F443_08499 [Phytophthora nicotianae P1569]ETK87198.1 hypothetical protein L915_08337 [Phytophthora nicotianae]ETP45090.1 hypothetical protein F442_08441 [Phytophthora nicotianae P10297]ETL40620.1 hypothetical protein L916_08263 [Phytophthora nicotianae]ETL93749.1 hypothetical protein L917_08164 [Phytophthora nicotianae]
MGARMKRPTSFAGWPLQTDPTPSAGKRSVWP